MTAIVTEKGTISVQLVAEALLEWRRRGLSEAPLLAQAGFELRRWQWSSQHH